MELLINSVLGLRGELAALAAAFLWAAMSLVYVRLGKYLSPLALNLSKGIAALFLFALTIAIRQEPLPNVDIKTILILFVSGALGIGLGDTAFFATIQCLGARRTLLMDMLSPGIATIVAWFFLQETLGLTQILGIVLAIGGVAWVVSEQTSTPKGEPIRWQWGILWGVLFACSHATGAVLSRAALATTSLTPLWSTFLRLFSGTIVLLLVVLPRREEKIAKVNPRLLVEILLTAFFSTYLAIWLQQTSLKFTLTGVAQSLSSTSPLFILAISAVRGEEVSPRSLLGVIIALGGVWLLFQ